MSEDDILGENESFTVEGLKKDIEQINKITLDWRFKMEFLPADREFATFRRAVTHLEKAIRLTDTVLMKFYGVSEEELAGISEESAED